MDLVPLSELTRLRIEPVIAYRARVPSWACDMEVTNPFFTWWLVEEGRVRLEWRGEVCEVTTGQAVFIPPGLRRHQVIAEGTRLVSVSFWAGWEDGRVLFSFPAPLTGKGAALEVLRQKARRLCRMVTSASLDQVGVAELRCEAGVGLHIRAALDVFVAELLLWSRRLGASVNLPNQGDQRLSLILTDLRKNLRAGPLPYANWQKQTGLSKVQLDRLSRRWIGQTLRQCRDEMLFREIRRSLAGGPDSLKELSARLGFFDGAHFCRWVKQRTRKSPSQLRGSWI